MYDVEIAQLRQKYRQRIATFRQKTQTDHGEKINDAERTFQYSKLGAQNKEKQQS